MSTEHVGIIGAGAWGTALAEAAGRAGCKVTLLTRSDDLASAINSKRQNAKCLPGVLLNRAVTASADPAALTHATFLVLAVPAQAARAVLGGLPRALLNAMPVILSAKGLESGTGLRQTEVLADVAPAALPLVLSGPSFAADVARGRPTAITLASEDQALGDRLALALASASFRPYVSRDPTGVELAGALKNIYALACGAVEGAELGLSARSALIARAFAEMTRLVVKLGGTPATMSGLAGLGDLTLSCTTPQSRNYATGLALGRGEKLARVLQDGIGLAEGVATAPVALELAHANKIDVPLIGAVNLLLSGARPIETIVEGLMTRPLKREEIT